jgi:hypothetical protein
VASQQENAGEECRAEQCERRFLSAAVGRRTRVLQCYQAGLLRPRVV